MSERMSIGEVAARAGVSTPTLRYYEAIGLIASSRTEGNHRAFDRDVLTALGLKPEELLAGFVHIGKSAKPNEDRPRPAITDLVTRF